MLPWSGLGPQFSNTGSSNNSDAHQSSAAMQHGGGGGSYGNLSNSNNSNGLQQHQQQQMQQQQQQGNQQQFQQQQPGQGVQAQQQGQNAQNQLQQQQQQQQQQPINLASVLHFLQTEWRRYERERNEWEIERGEMRARIALLEGERRGTENLKTDLMRRVKMLEYALKQERSKYLTMSSQQAQAQAQAAATAAAASATAGQAQSASAAPAQTQPQNAAKEKKDADPKSKLVKEEKQASARDSPSPEGAPSKEKDGIEESKVENGASVPEVVVSSATNGPSSSINNANKATDAPSSPHAAAPSLPPAASTSNAAPPLTNLTRPASTVSLSSLPGAAGGTGALSALAAGGSTINNVGLGWNPSLGRDPRGRAKSRDYLKQCLQEINYLTSLSTLNPLPEKMSTGLSRPRKVTVEMPVISHAEQQAQAQQQQKEEQDKAQNPAVAAVNVAGNTVLPLNVAASQNAAQSVGAESSPTVQTTNLVSTTNAAENILPNTTFPPSSSAPSSSAPLPPKAVQPAAPIASAMLNSHPSLEATNTVSESSPATGLIPLATLTNGSAAKEGGDVFEEQSRTAIFRPESAEEWRKALKKAGQAAGISGAAAGMPESETVEDLDRESGQASAAGRARSDTLMSTSSSTSTVVEGDSDHKVWKARRALRAHLDSARCLAFDRTERANDVLFATGGDDCVIKWWRLPLTTVSASARGLPLPDSEPSHTYRGHTNPVTALAVSSATNRIYSASMDASVGIWAIPHPNRETYAPFEKRMNIAKLEGHTDAVWDVCLLASGSPSTSSAGATGVHHSHINERIATASSDGTVKIWDVSPSMLNEDGTEPESGLAPSSGLKLSWHARGTAAEEDDGQHKKIIPTCLALCQSDMTHLAVGYQDAAIRIFEVETGKLVNTLKFADDSESDNDNQVNRLVSHPTLPLLIAAYEDKTVRLFDLKTFNCTYSFVAHTAPITSLDVDPSGLTLLTGSHDGNLRFWDVLVANSSSGTLDAESEGKGCIQEISGAHRLKGEEGVLEVRFHPTLPFVGSVGADGSMRVFG